MDVLLLSVTAKEHLFHMKNVHSRFYMHIEPNSLNIYQSEKIKVQPKFWRKRKHTFKSHVLQLITQNWRKVSKLLRHAYFSQLDEAPSLLGYDTILIGYWRFLYF